MRETRNAQASIFDRYAKHEIGNQLAMMSEILDSCADLIDWVEGDLASNDSQSTGRVGLPVESVLRCAILKQVRQLSYKELAFYLEDSGSFRSFARLPQGVVPRKSALQDNISRIKPQTWERINQALVGRALADEVEHGKQVRIDSTVVETNIHEPSDKPSFRLVINAQFLAFTRYSYYSKITLCNNIVNLSLLRRLRPLHCLQNDALGCLLPAKAATTEAG